MTTPIPTDQLAAVLTAFLARITPDDLARLQTDRIRCAVASLNYGNRAQLDAQAEFRLSVLTAVGHLIEHDRVLISNAIRAATRET